MFKRKLINIKWEVFIYNYIKLDLVGSNRKGEYEIWIPFTLAGILLVISSGSKITDTVLGEIAAETIKLIISLYFNSEYSL